MIIEKIRDGLIISALLVATITSEQASKIAFIGLLVAVLLLGAIIANKQSSINSKQNCHE